MRHEAVGNAMCVPVLRWVGERIAFLDSLPEGRVTSFLSTIIAGEFPSPKKIRFRKRPV